jgi:TFIIF-interacting CTD phosphatase-like protein
VKHFNDRLADIVDWSVRRGNPVKTAAASADLAFVFGPEESRVTVSVRVRPGALQFLGDLAPLHEPVVFTASVKPYADRVVDHIDPHGHARHRLGGSWVKDLPRLSRRLERVIVVDNPPGAYLLHPCNAIPIPPWFDDPGDTALVHEHIRPARVRVGVGTLAVICK